MKKLFTLCLFFYAVNLFAQPANDDCATLIDLGVVPFCPDTVFYSNELATESDIGNDNIPGIGACGNNDITFVGNDVWFAFTSSDTITDYTITVTGITDGMGSTAMSNPQIMIYRGDCSFDNLALLVCGAAADGETVLELDAIGLDPNTVYFIRINDWSGTATPNWGTFQLCVDEIQPVNTIDEMGSNSCTGELYDTGGPDGDYSNNENHSFTICPPSPNNNCIIFNLEYFNIENFNDALTFYDGQDVNSPVITTINGSGGLSGDPQISAGGGVCLVIQASSGCMTVEFTSDATSTMEGFGGYWECSAAACETILPITVDANVTDQDIIDNVSTPQTIVTIDTIICENGAYGTFLAGDDTQLGLEKGLVLTSGSINNAVGPNTETAVTTPYFIPGDDDLDYLSIQSGSGSLSNDACVVELDVFVATDQLTFEYVFGSDEYPEWVNTDFNDIFAFLISGPGIPGDVNIANQENIAIVPNTTTPVQINSVNNITNWEYYRNNEQGISIEYDGLTSDYLGFKKSLTAQRSVIPCNTYHLKLAIADRGDWSLDSGVFISEIKGGTPNLSVNFASGVDYLVENCTGEDDELLVTLSNPLPDSISYDVTVTGTATLGVDYTLDIPSQIVLAPGQTQLNYPLIPLTDTLTEGSETIIITLSKNFGCGDINLAEITIEITDRPVVEIFTGQDTAFVCQDTCIVLQVSGATDYFWEPVSVVDDPFSASPLACPTVDQWVSVIGSIGVLPGCSDVDSIYLIIVDPQMDLIALDELNICEGDSVHLQAINNVLNQGLVWSPADGLSEIIDEFVTASPVTTTTYSATVSLEGCSATDTITVNVDPFDFPEITTNDTTICQGQSVVLASSIQGSTTIYEWTPDTALVPSNDVSGPIATPLDNTVYTFIATSQNAYCADTTMVDVEVIPAEVTIMPEDTAYICLGESVTLNANTTTGQVNWTPSDHLNDTTSLSVVADPGTSLWYFASMSIGACTVTDSVFVRVDSLPEMSIMAVPFEDPYCPGDTVTLFSPTYEPIAYPDIAHLWTPMDGVESDITNYNLVFITSDTILFLRETTNNACSATDSIQINVSPPTTIDIMPIDPSICAGESVQLIATSPDVDEFEWSPDDGTLSCTECGNPTASPSNTTVYTVESEFNGCPVMASIEVEVIPDVSEGLINSTNICEGESILLNLSPGGPNDMYTWTASPADPTLESDIAQPMVSPLQTTTYSVTISNGICPPFEGEIEIEVIQIPTLTVSDDVTICANETTTLVATSSVPNIGNFTWSNLETGAEISVSPDFSSQFIVIYDFGCAFNLMDTILVDVLPAPGLDLIDDAIICSGESIALNLDSGNPEDMFVWTSEPDDPSLDPDTDQPVVTPNQTTTYFVSADNGICDDQGQVTIIVQGNPSLTISPDQVICLGEEITLTASSTEDGGTFNWSNGQSGESISVSPDATQNYTLTYFNDCEDTLVVSVLVEVVESPEVSIITDPLLADSTFYQGDVITLTAVLLNPIAGATYTWNTGQTGPTITVNADLVPLETFTVTVSTPDECEDEASVNAMVAAPLFEMPNTFTPNNDDINDYFNAVFVGNITINDFRIYNRWGELVYDNETPTTGWDGTYKGKNAPSDTYMYYITVTIPNGTTTPLQGDLTLIR